VASYAGECDSKGGSREGRCPRRWPPKRGMAVPVSLRAGRRWLHAGERRAGAGGGGRAGAAGAVAAGQTAGMMLQG